MCYIKIESVKIVPDTRIESSKINKETCSSPSPSLPLSLTVSLFTLPETAVLHLISGYKSITISYNNCWHCSSSSNNSNITTTNNNNNYNDNNCEDTSSTKTMPKSDSTGTTQCLCKLIFTIILLMLQQKTSGKLCMIHAPHLYPPPPHLPTLPLHRPLSVADIANWTCF